MTKSLLNHSDKSVVNVLIEISVGSSVKYEYDEKSGHLVVDRFLFTSMYYPFNYGFVPGTISEDGDPLDVLVLTLKEIVPGTILPTRIIGMLVTEDEEGKDIKLMGVPADFVDPESYKVQDALKLLPPTKERISHFFEYYKSLERGKWVKVGKWHGKNDALKYLEECLSKKEK